MSQIVVDPDIRSGIPIVQGTRVGAHELADAVATDGIEMALKDFPSVTREGIEAAVAYAAENPRPVRPERGLLRNPSEASGSARR